MKSRTIAILLILMFFFYFLAFHCPIWLQFPVTFSKSISLGEKDFCCLDLNVLVKIPIPILISGVYRYLEIAIQPQSARFSYRFSYPYPHSRSFSFNALPIGSIILKETRLPFTNEVIYRITLNGFIEGQLQIAESQASSISLKWDRVNFIWPLTTATIAPFSSPLSWQTYIMNVKLTLKCVVSVNFYFSGIEGSFSRNWNFGTIEADQPVFFKIVIIPPIPFICAVVIFFFPTLLRYIYFRKSKHEN